MYSLSQDPGVALAERVYPPGVALAGAVSAAERYYAARSCGAAARAGRRRARCRRRRRRDAATCAPSGRRPSRIARVSSFSSVRRRWRCSGRAPSSSSKPSRASRATSASSTVSAMPRSASSRSAIRSTIEPRDPLDVLGRERLERHDLVDPVDELGQERRPWRRRVMRAASSLGVAGREPERPPGPAGAEVRRHDDDGVREVDRPALAVGEPAVVHELEQDVPHVGVAPSRSRRAARRCTAGAGPAR